jgi:prephenate dehydrogenase/chorismate mutase
LRDEIAATDARILGEIGHRLEIAREIGRLKQAEGLPLRDYLIESEVLRRWTEGLAAVRVPPERTQALVRWLVEESVHTQESIPEPPTQNGASSDVLVVGGLGQMGGWIRDFLRAAGYQVGVFDRRRPTGPLPFPVLSDLRRGAQDADVIVIATPMRAATSIYRELWSTETEATIFDILSIKDSVIPWIRRGIDKGFHVASSHPLFGPGTRSLFGRNLLVLDCGDRSAADRVVRLFQRTALRISRLPLEEHDPLMADVLGLPHALSLLFARTLQKGRYRAEELVRGAPTSFLRIADVTQTVTRENPELVSDIQTLNPASSALFERIQAALKELTDAVKSGNPSRYSGILAEGRELLEQPPRLSVEAGDGERKGGPSRSPRDR